MKKTKFFSLFAATLAVGFVACNNESDSTTATDSLSTGTTTTDAGSTNSTSTSNQNYTALADTFNTNSEKGVYLDARTGKSIKIKVDPQTGKRTNATTGEPVWRYVDNRNWGVYGGEGWDTVGSAKMQGNKLMYRGDNNTWVDYNKRWKSDDDRMMNDWKMQNKGTMGSDTMNSGTMNSNKMNSDKMSSDKNNNTNTNRTTDSSNNQ
jgi:hypothetical protein